MNKSTNFTGQPILAQILKLIPKYRIDRLAKECGTDHYYKKLKTYNHLVTMLFTIFSHSTSLREVVTGVLACGNRLNHLGLDYSPARSTLSDANCDRSYIVFEKIYMDLYSRLARTLPDSRSSPKWFKRLYIMDSTTITLFKEILKNAGRSPINGKRKGGIKAHTLIKADEDVPCLVRMGAAAANDVLLMKYLKLPPGSIITFDKAYKDYKMYEKYTEEGITFVTRLNKTSVYEHVKDRKVSEKQKEQGVISDQVVILGHNQGKKATKVKVRLIRYYSKENKMELEFITNNLKFSALTIALIYKKRWQIESLFKRLKQNFPLQYFLGDNENAIKIQIWCALIADFILNVIQKQVQRKWSFSGMASMVRLHLMTYIDLKAFLNNPEESLRGIMPKEDKTLISLFPT